MTLGEIKTQCIFIEDCMEPRPTPWTWAAWLVFSEFIRTQSLVSRKMGTLDGGEAELSPLGRSLQEKKRKSQPIPPPPPPPLKLKVSVSSVCNRSDDHRQTAVSVLRSLFAHLRVGAWCAAISAPDVKNVKVSLTFNLMASQWQSPTIHHSGRWLCPPL